MRTITITREEGLDPRKVVKSYYPEFNPIQEREINIDWEKAFKKREKVLLKRFPNIREIKKDKGKGAHYAPKRKYKKRETPPSIARKVSDSKTMAIYPNIKAAGLVNDIEYGKL